ncbi:MAG: helix-hairpin-helix domain-containing protein [Lachnospiraceae bacterium]
MSKRKKRIWNVLACLPVLLFLACGAAREEKGIVSLLDGQGGNAAKSELPSEAETASPDGEKEEAEAPTGEKTVFVHICGEVVSPGVYEVSAESRIYDVLLLAGGFTEEAAEDYVNLALPVADGMQVVIPSAYTAEAERRQLQAEKAGLININTATAAELCTLPGIGESRAADIIAYREEHGGFGVPEEIMQVTGIKEGMYEKIRDMIYVD